MRLLTWLKPGQSDFHLDPDRDEIQVTPARNEPDTTSDDEYTARSVSDGDSAMNIGIAEGRSDGSEPENGEYIDTEDEDDPGGESLGDISYHGLDGAFQPFMECNPSVHIDDKGCRACSSSSTTRASPTKATHPCRIVSVPDKHETAAVRKEATIATTLPLEEKWKIASKGCGAVYEAQLDSLPNGIT